MTSVSGLQRQEFRARRWRWLLPVLLGVLLMAAGAFLWWRDAAAVRRPLAWSALGSGAVLALWFGSPFWRRAPVLWFDERGLSAALPGRWPIAWADIEAVRLVRRGGRDWLAIDRVAAARAAGRRSQLQEQMARSAGTADLAMPLGGLQQSGEAIVGVVALALEHQRLVGR
jgi:hypothetical protein